MAGKPRLRKEMNPFYTGQLSLAGIRVVDRQQLGNNLLFEAVTIDNEPTICQACRTATGFRQYGSREQLFMDLPLRGDRVGIRLLRKRYWCASCKKVRFEALPQMVDDHRVTRRLFTYVACASLTETYSSLVRETGLSGATIRRIAAEFLKGLDRKRVFQTPVHLGLDELCFGSKGPRRVRAFDHKNAASSSSKVRPPRAILSDLERKTIFALFPDNKTATLCSFFKGLEDRGRIAVVCIDFNHAYRRAIREALPHADVVIDKFHILQRVNEALDQVRQEVKSQLGLPHRKRLKYDSRLLRKRHASFSNEQQDALAKWTTQFPELRQAYEAKEAFYEIWEAKDAEEGRARYSAWCHALPASIRNQFRSVITRVDQWDREIFAYFKWRFEFREGRGITNSFTEALNGIVRDILRAGRGYSFTTMRGKALYSRAYAKYKSKKGTLFSHYEWEPSDSRSEGHDPETEYDGPMPNEPVETPVEQAVRAYLYCKAEAEKMPPRTSVSKNVWDGIQFREVSSLDIRRHDVGQTVSVERRDSMSSSDNAGIQHETANGRLSVPSESRSELSGDAINTSREADRRLSKSKYVSGLQCLKRLYLEVHHPHLAQQDVHRANIMSQGTEVGKLARDRYPGGQVVASDHTKLNEALAETAQLMEKPDVPAIFEATFAADGVLVRVDVLERVGSSAWRLIECKAANKKKDEHEDDLAIQAHVLQRSGVVLEGLSLLYLNREYVRKGKALDPDKLYRIEDVTAAVTPLLSLVPGRIREMKQALGASGPPVRDPSEHCQSPYACPFWSHCTENKSNRWLYRVPDRGLMYPTLLAKGIQTFDDIPNDIPLPPPLSHIKKNVEWISDGLRRTFSWRNKSPMHHLHVGAAMLAVPPFSGTQPWGKLPFMLAHVQETATGEVEERCWTSEQKRDPRRAFIRMLLEAVGRDGTIYVYSQFILRVINDLAYWSTTYRADLKAIHARIVDLRALVQEEYFHPELLPVYADLPYGNAVAIRESLPLLPTELQMEDVTRWDEGWPSRQYQQLMGRAASGEERAKILSEVQSFGFWGMRAVRAFRQTLMAKARYTPPVQHGWSLRVQNW